MFLGRVIFGVYFPENILFMSFYAHFWIIWWKIGHGIWSIHSLVKMKSSVSLLVVLLFFCKVAFSTANPVAQKPNIILILVDDMGWSDLSSFGNQEAKTPNIDRLAAEGIAFEQFYVNSPICSPSRTALLTGTYPQRWNITSYLASRKLNKERGIAHWLDPRAPTLSGALKKAGYTTGHFGKWHMGGQRDVTEAPAIASYGFDESLTNFEGLGAKLLPLTKDENGNVGRIWEDAVRLGEPVTWMQRSQLTGGFVDAAIGFMKKAGHTPFFVNVWPDDVHSPFWPPFEEYGLTRKSGKRALYLAVLEEMDKQLGKLFEYVRSDAQLRDNTLILFCSDNGPEKGAGKAGGLKGHKGELYEGGIRSPLIVWGPGLLGSGAQGTRNQTSLIAAIDISPSLIALSGAPANDLSDGENLLNTLLGKVDRGRRAPLFYSRPPDRKNANGKKSLPDLAVRKGDWKLLCDHDGGRKELYNVVKDPNETDNLAGKYQKRARKMTQSAMAWYGSLSGH